MTYLRRIRADIRAGLRGCVDLLLWGHVYPRHVPVRVPTTTEES